MIDCNKRIKLYPDGTQEVMIANEPIWTILENSDPEPIRAGHKRDPEHELSQERIASNRMRAIRRARTKLRDYALCTHMTHFVTLTVNPARADRYNEQEIVKRTTQWCDNQVKRHGLRYILVPERHKDGAIHWHGLCDLSGLRLVDSGTISGIYDKPARPARPEQRGEWIARGGHVVYNIPGWTLGYSTALALYGDYRAAVSYTCKYIGKAVGENVNSIDKIGGRWYYSGGDLGTPTVILDHADMVEEGYAHKHGYTVNIPNTKLSLTMVTIGKDEVYNYGIERAQQVPRGYVGEGYLQSDESADSDQLQISC